MIGKESPLNLGRDSPRHPVDMDATVPSEEKSRVSFSPSSIPKSATSPRSSFPGGKKQKRSYRGSSKMKNSSRGSRNSKAKGKQTRPSIERVFPKALEEKIKQEEVDIRDHSKIHEYLKKFSRQEYKIIVKNTKTARTWSEKLQQFPSATSYFAYGKNRYRDVLADEVTRVKLEGQEHDYINANYILGKRLPGCPRVSYIAGQAPTPATFNDFWLMIWQTKSAVTVMLTRFREKGVVKAHCYWPKNVDQTTKYGEIAVTLMNQKSLPGISVSTLKLVKKECKDGIIQTEEQRVVYHLHYTEWPDFGVPRSTKVIRNLISYTNLYFELGGTQGLTGY